MRKIREVLRLRLEADLSVRQISICTKVSVGSIQKLLKSAQALGLTLALTTELDDGRLAAPVLSAGRYRYLGPPCCTRIGLCPSGAQARVSKQLLWEEYTQRYPNGCYSYSQFCDRYKSWCRCKSAPCARSTRRGKSSLSTTAGPVPIVSPTTGEVRQAQVFVAVLGASNYTFAEATWSQSLPGLAAKPCPCFEFFGGTPALLIPDNLKSGVSKACRYDPELSPATGSWPSTIGWR